jgi:outer membrane lipoprotein
MKQMIIRCTAVLCLVLLSACASVISSELRKEARKDLVFDQITRNPTAYLGSVVIWGGVIINVDNSPDGSSITLLQTPLDDRDQPKDSEYSRGRFIARTPYLADPIVFEKGRKITVVGEIAGKETMLIGRSALYSYPVIRIKQLVLWSSTDYLPPVYYVWHRGPDGFLKDEGSAQ